MTWFSFGLIAVAGFFIGGAYSFWRNQKRKVASIIMLVAAAGCVVAALLWWQPAGS